ncbi:MAG: FAD-dependent oxidoreductase [Prolixibacteraceae bacterium]|nr:FAD-dependent oxidoreductase [Prolixibacteraceae bacterium]
MIREDLSPIVRRNAQVMLNSDLVVVGGGMAGTCAAITAARSGIKVILVQDRPVLGGNGSSEVRLWILGATSHLGNNNRWSREGGVIDEILVENLYRNKEGNAIIFDTILLEKVTNEPNITLLLNTMVFDLEKKDDVTISTVKAFCSQNSTEYTLTAPLFCDASGDGIVGYKAGASFRMGAECKGEFGEGFTPTKEYGELLGHTMYFYSKDTGKPVKYIAPSFALKDITKIPKFKSIKTGQMGCNFWWFEFGGRGDTILDTEGIKWQLWSVIYGVWDYIKNSGNFPDAENLSLEWVGTIPGKRESRRFEGPYMLKQQDIVEQTHFYDAVSFGGWAIDLHPADGVFSELPSCNQYHSKGIYEIPYRCFISKDIQNLFIAGRLISASHVAFGSTRVMATSGHGGQVVGMAAALCQSMNLAPADFTEPTKIKLLQDKLNLAGQSIPGLPIDESKNLAASATISASSELVVDLLPFDGEWFDLKTAAGQLLPLRKGIQYSFDVLVDVAADTVLQAELQVSSKVFNYTPDVLIEKQRIVLKKGVQQVPVSFSQTLKNDQYAFLIFRSNPDVKIRCSEKRISGIVSVFNKTNPAVNNYGKQTPPENSGFDSFEFWCPDRRPKGQNLAMTISPALDCFGAQNIVNGLTRPYIRPNAWVADRNDPKPTLTLKWREPKEIRSVTLFLDTDFDHPMESSQMGHPEDVIPFVIRNYRILDESENVLFEASENHQTINHWIPEKSLSAKLLKFEFEHPNPNVPASIFEIYVD